jgi:hypothetical protein
MGGYGPLVHLADLLDHESQVPSGFINLGNTLAHKVKHEALSQFNSEAYVSVNEPTNRSVQFHCLEDELINISACQVMNSCSRHRFSRQWTESLQLSCLTPQIMNFKHLADSLIQGYLVHKIRLEAPG